MILGTCCLVGLLATAAIVVVARARAREEPQAEPEVMDMNFNYGDDYEEPDMLDSRNPRL